jgi:hypothetical protein
VPRFDACNARVRLWEGGGHDTCGWWMMQSAAMLLQTREGGVGNCDTMVDIWVWVLGFQGRPLCSTNLDWGRGKIFRQPYTCSNFGASPTDRSKLFYFLMIFILYCTC